MFSRKRVKFSILGKYRSLRMVTGLEFVLMSLLEILMALLIRMFTSFARKIMESFIDPMKLKWGTFQLMIISMLMRI
jgi:hypothetical protein